MRKRVYIAGPLVIGDLRENIERGVVAFIRLIKAGLAPFCPHLSCFAGSAHSFDGRHLQYWVKADLLPRGTTVEEWYETDLPWVDVSEALLRLPGEGKGSDGEVARATELGIPVFYSVEEVIAWSRQTPPESEPLSTSEEKLLVGCQSESSADIVEPARTPTPNPPRGKKTARTTPESPTSSSSSPSREGLNA